MDLNKILQNKTKQKTKSTPSFFDLSKRSYRQELKKLFNKKQIQFVTDDYKEQLKEYFHITNPQIRDGQILEKNFQNYLQDFVKNVSLIQQGKWVYFPWLQTLTHILNEKEFFMVRTARNKLLITKKEQEKFYKATVGIGGLSIGGSVATAIVLQGGAKRIRLADFDSLSLSNTNRICSGIQNLGLLKTEITARQIYEINPYAKLEIFPQGITEKNIEKFMKGLDIMVDEMDNLSIKLLIRIQAKKIRIPVLMGADNADMAIIDIERYDKNPKLPFFHSRLGKLDSQKLQRMSKLETGKAIAQLVGLENHTERMILSLQKIGKSIVSWPQLGGTAMLNGSAIAYCVRKIVNGQDVGSNRGVISLDEKLTSGYFSKTQRKSRQNAIKDLKKIFNL